MFIIALLPQKSLSEDENAEVEGREEAEEIIDGECLANKAFADDRLELLQHCAVLAEAVVTSRAINADLSRLVLTALAGHKLVATLHRHLDLHLFCHPLVFPYLANASLKI